MAAIVAIAVFGAAGVFAWREFAPVRDAERMPAASSAAPDDPWAGYPDGWSELPAPPKTPQGAAFVWTGSALLLWGGSDDPAGTMTSDGYSFDPSTKTWQTLPPAPVAVANARPVWTGSEAIFWGGNDAEHNGRREGVAYDPFEKTWRILPAAPLDHAWGGVTVWTGTELIVWGGGDPGDARNRAGAAYDPSTDVWRPIADAPIGLNLASGVWSGTEMIVFGSLLNGNNVASTDHAVGEAYDPATDSWRTLAPSALSPQASSSVWLDEGMFSWDYETHGAWYDAGTDTWGDVQKLPIEPSECYPDSVTVGHVLFAWFCGDVATYDTITGNWRRVLGGMTSATVEANGQPYSLFRFASLAAAGDVVALAGEGITVSGGTPCYGCPGSPTAFWVYRPPSDVPTAAELTPPAFEPADGWGTISTSTDPDVADPTSCCATWAANVPFAPEDLSKNSVDGVLREWTFPGTTIRDLNPDGVVIVAEVDPTWVYRCCGHDEAATAPLRLTDADVQLAWEGQIAPNVPLYVFDVFVEGRDLDIRIFFGSLHSSDATLSAAQDELSRLVIPPGPGDPSPSG